ncbi:MFS transporter [Candidatus Comchoanobacter bicostacola]|uniref:MFS transporter n=1 Tax=Candidatus Comchoanobacter bicostacola TaxID=2919598 RepID=A0ABY5DIE5_9GAMM|nr:MFS transporter [Candidatus Comchoanobacter bicostacola]UTC24390.1 MFS transporter [Candidatus Comchoanobacter bicostacola]
MSNKQIQPILIVSTAALLYFFMFFLRIMMSVISEDLSQEFNLSSQEIGFLSASFVCAYAFAQIPMGRIIAQIGSRKTIIYSTIGIIIGSFLFQASHSLMQALLSRALIGLCFGGAFIIPLSLSRQWLPSSYFASSVGMIQLLGCVGAMVSGTPIDILVKQIGWRDTAFFTLLISILLFIVFCIIIKDKNEPDTSSVAPLGATLYKILSNKNYWLIGVVALASWAPIGGFTELWGIPYLMKIQGVSKQFVTTQLIYTWVSIAISSPICGYWAEHSDLKKPVYACYIIGIVSTLLIISGWITHPWIISFLLICMGITAGGQPIAFSMINRISDSQTQAIATGFCNICVIAGAFLMQPLIGFLLDRPMNDYYYYLSFSPIVLTLLLGIIANYIVSTEKTR